MEGQAQHDQRRDALAYGGVIHAATKEEIQAMRHGEDVRAQAQIQVGQAGQARLDPKSAEDVNVVTHIPPGYKQLMADRDIDPARLRPMDTTYEQFVWFMKGLMSVQGHEPPDQNTWIKLQGMVASIGQAKPCGCKE